jgi:hypothetical protein
MLTLALTMDHEEYLAEIATGRAVRSGTMAGRHSFARLRAGFLAESRARAEALAGEMDRDLSLAELRRARSLTQNQLAADLHGGQASIQPRAGRPPND